jgi:RsiW-degrading membrane proteinase PrsW (M82 family)
LRRKEDDEPIDPVIYMVTTALGFSALENMFFLTNTLIQDGITISIITMNLRFTGATLLHVISSAAIGIAIGLSFYKDTNMKRFYLFIGLLISAILHISFNLFIIINDGKNTISIFFFVWVMIAILILLFEKLKKVHPFKTQ